MARQLHCLLTPTESVVALIDFQPEMLDSVGSGDRRTILHNAVVLAKMVKLFDVPVVLTTVTAQTFRGALVGEIQAALPDQVAIERTSMNSWEDRNFKAAVTDYGRKKIVFAGLWTEAAVCFPALEAIAEGYDVHVPTDACGDLTLDAHERAIQRAVQAGVVPTTTLQVMFEWQRDWGRADTYQGCLEILEAHCGRAISAAMGGRLAKDEPDVGG